MNRRRNRRKLTANETIGLGAAVGALLVAALIALLDTAGLSVISDPESVGTPHGMWLPVLVSGALVGGLLVRWATESRWSLVRSMLVGAYVGAFAMPALVVVMWPILGAGPLPAADAPLILVVAVAAGALVGAWWYRSSEPTEELLVRILALSVLTAIVLIAVVRSPSADRYAEDHSPPAPSAYPYP